MRAAINEQLTHQHEVVLCSPAKKQRKRKKKGYRRGGKPSGSNFNLKQPSSLMYDGTVTGDGTSLSTGARTGGEGAPPQKLKEWKEMVTKEKAKAITRLSTPLWKRRAIPKHSLTNLLGRGPNVFMTNIASRQSKLSHAGSLSEGSGSKLGSPHSASSNPTTGKISPFSQPQQNSTLERPSVGSIPSRRRASIDMTSKSNNVPLLATFNSYKRNQTKRSKEEVRKRDR